jgi:hypothetical protein
MKKKHRERLLRAIDLLAIALTNHAHKWSNTERKLYESAVKTLT